MTFHNRKINLYSELEIEEIVQQGFPLVFHVNRVGFRRFPMEEAIIEFGARGVESHNQDDYNDVSKKIYTYDPTRRWAYWRAPRFKTESDLVLAKMMFG